MFYVLCETVVTVFAAVLSGARSLDEPTKPTKRVVGLGGGRISFLPLLYLFIKFYKFLAKLDEVSYTVSKASSKPRLRGLYIVL